MTFQTNVIESFSRTKQDIYALYEHIQYLHNQISLLREENVELKVKTGLISLPASFIASKTGKKIHVESCTFAGNIKKRITFTSKDEAVKQGYGLCRCIVG
jgi:regulator of replication initiation timing